MPKGKVRTKRDTSQRGIIGKKVKRTVTQASQIPTKEIKDARGVLGTISNRDIGLFIGIEIVGTCSHAGANWLTVIAFGAGRLAVSCDFIAKGSRVEWTCLHAKFS